jgi:hypothetical protein
VTPEDIEKLKRGDMTAYTRILKKGSKEYHKRKNKLLTVKPSSSPRLPPM